MAVGSGPISTHSGAATIVSASTFVATNDVLTAFGEMMSPAEGAGGGPRAHAHYYYEDPSMR